MRTDHRNRRYKSAGWQHAIILQQNRALFFFFLCNNRIGCSVDWLGSLDMVEQSIGKHSTKNAVDHVIKARLGHHSELNRLVQISEIPIVRLLLIEPVVRGG